MYIAFVYFYWVQSVEINYQISITVFPHSKETIQGKMWRHFVVTNLNWYFNSGNTCYIKVLSDDSLYYYFEQDHSVIFFIKNGFLKNIGGF